MRERAFNALRNLFAQGTNSLKRSILNEFPETLDILINSLRLGEKTIAIRLAFNILDEIFRMDEESFQRESSMEVGYRHQFLEKGGMRHLEKLKYHHDDGFLKHLNLFMDDFHEF